MNLPGVRRLVGTFCCRVIDHGFPRPEEMSNKPASPANGGQPIRSEVKYESQRRLAPVAHLRQAAFVRHGRFMPV